METLHTWVLGYGGSSAWIIYPSLLVFVLLAVLISRYIARCTPHDFTPPPADDAGLDRPDSEDTHV